MAFPRVASVSSLQAGTGAATALNIPAGVMAGDLLVCFASEYAGNVTQISVSVGTWTTVTTSFNTIIGTAIFARIADGTSADRITLNKANADWCATILRIVDHGVTDIAADIKVGTWATATSATADPPSLNAGSTDDWLWCAMAAVRLTATGNTLDGVPANYTERYRNKSASSTTSLAMGVATRPLNAGTQDPGTFAISASLVWRAQTIAIKPGTARTGARIDECPVVVTATGTTAVSASFTPVANSVLIAMCGVANTSGTGTQTGTVTDSLSSGWTKLDEYASAAGAGLCQIWALDIGASPAARTVTLTGGGTSPGGCVLSLFSLLDTEPVASILGTADHAAGSDVESDTITVSTDGSLVFSMYVDSAASQAGGSPGSGLMLDMYFNDTTNGQKQAAQHAAAVQNAGNFTYAIGTITGSQSSLAAWELLAVAGAALADGAYWGSRAA